MSARTTNEIVSFRRSFQLKGVDRLLPPGDYRVATDEELVEGLSFPVWRRVSTLMFAPSSSRFTRSVEMLSVDPAELAAARERDAAAERFPASGTVRVGQMA